MLCFKAQSSKLQRLFSLKRGKRDVRALSFELSKMSPQVGLAVAYHVYSHTTLQHICSIMCTVTRRYNTCTPSSHLCTLTVHAKTAAAAAERARVPAQEAPAQQSTVTLAPSAHEPGDCFRRCGLLQHTATHCNTLQSSATQRNAAQRAAI